MILSTASGGWVYIYIYISGCDEVMESLGAPKLIRLLCCGGDCFVVMLEAEDDNQLNYFVMQLQLLMHIHNDKLLQRILRLFICVVWIRKNCKLLIVFMTLIWLSLVVERPIIEICDANHLCFNIDLILNYLQLSCLHWRGGRVKLVDFSNWAPLFSLPLAHVQRSRFNLDIFEKHIKNFFHLFH